VALYAGFPRALNALAVIDQVLAGAAIPPPPAMRQIRLADHDTVVAQTGDAGPAVILVHALGLDWRMREPLMAQLSAGGYSPTTSAATDRRPAPRPRSPWPARPPT
jgi:3-oxoadipate enol-lactonase